MNNISENGQDSESKSNRQNKQNNNIAVKHSNGPQTILNSPREHSSKPQMDKGSQKAQMKQKNDSNAAKSARDENQVSKKQIKGDIAEAKQKRVANDKEDERKGNLRSSNQEITKMETKILK